MFCGNVSGWVRRWMVESGGVYSMFHKHLNEHFMFYLPRPKADIKRVFLHVPIRDDCHKITDHDNLKSYSHSTDVILADYSSRLFRKSRFTKK